MGSGKHFDVLENIKKHISQLRPWFPKQAVICIGEYPIQILLKGPFVGKMENTLPIFIDKHSEDIVKWSQSRVENYNILGLDTNIDTHFWFNVLPHITKNDAFIARLKNKPIDKLREAIIISSIWDGVGSALLPTLISQLKVWNINPVAIAVLPSKLQSSDVHFNAFSSMGICASNDSTPILLIERDNLESYVGVDRKGSIIKGNTVVNYILELMLAKETLVQELSELSRSFNVRIYTVLPATGASLEIYGSLENILTAVLHRPLLTFDLSNASILYVLLRMPIQLKDKLSRGRIELAIANWFKERARLKSIYISDPIYAEDVSDRIDVVMLVGGFDVTRMFTSMEKEVSVIKNDAIERGLIAENEWQEIAESLVGD
ncbi:MAG: hypothetical protein OEW95_06210 [Candidatus Bathyarchaeota archaeon]|nr:hypothetical protein [Candidatus Bathyarchaeota archaeon]